jgi:hypothetical protein
MRNKIKSLQKVDNEYIARIASKINNDYHLFLTSCIHADEDIEEVKWSYLEDCAEEISSTLHKRAPLGFVLTEMIQSVIDQSNQELKQKQDAGGNEQKTPTGFSPARNKQKRKHKNKNKNNNSSDDDDDSDREVDPQSRNPKVNPNWKMSWKEFRQVISPHVANCPKVQYARCSTSSESATLDLAVTIRMRISRTR